jgi:hypothetical protein
VARRAKATELSEEARDAWRSAVREAKIKRAERRRKKQGPETRRPFEPESPVRKEGKPTEENPITLADTRQTITKAVPWRHGQTKGNLGLFKPLRGGHALAGKKRPHGGVARGGALPNDEQAKTKFPEFYDNAMGKPMASTIG